MNDDQLLRYSRHILLPEIDFDGQQRWCNARALIIGAGGLGSAAAFYLAASGVGKMVICDDDIVELSNLQRQIIHDTARLGERKALSACQSLAALNPEIRLEARTTRMREDSLCDEMQHADIALDCSDNFATRHAINRASVATATPLVVGAALRFDGQLMVFDRRQHDAACYHCVFPQTSDAEAGPACSDSGVFAPLVGMVGCWQAAEALKLLAAAGTSLHNRLMLINSKNGHSRLLQIQQDPDCPVCAKPLS